MSFVQVKRTDSDISLMADLLINTHAIREPDEVLIAGGKPYLERWWLRRSYLEGCVYLHHVLASDPDEDCHDHPWDSTSIILRGIMSEFILLPDGKQHKVAPFKPGDIVNRKASDAHRLVVEGEPVWTLFMTGPRLRPWGFNTPDGWVPWREYVEKSDRRKTGQDAT